MQNNQLTGSWTHAVCVSGASFWTLKRWKKQGKIQTVIDASGKERVVLPSLYKAMGLAPSENTAA